eukprot:contig_3110_g665
MSKYSRWRNLFRPRRGAAERARLEPVEPRGVSAALTGEVFECELLDRSELSARLASLTHRAPLDRLVINPAVCSIDRLRVYALRTSLRWVLDWEAASRRLGTLLLLGLRVLPATGWAALGHGYWWARLSVEAIGQFGSWLTHPPTEREPPGANESPVDRSGSAPVAADELSAQIKRWLDSPNYARPLLDDWGGDGGQDPPFAWTDLVIADGGLADFAVFGLQVWMVVADLDDGAGDLYLTMGAAGRPPRRNEAAAGGDSGLRAGGGGSSPNTFVSKGDFLYGLQYVHDAKDAVRQEMAWPSQPPSMWRLPFPAPPTTLPSSTAVEEAQQAALRRWLPDLPPAKLSYCQALLDVTRKPLNTGDSHRGLLRDWHARWEKVLTGACEVHGICGQALAEVRRLPLVGFYPAMRVALDALCGRWDPLAGAVLSRSGTVGESGWKDGASYTCLALGSKDRGATLWKASAATPFLSLAQMFDSDLVDLSWGADGYTMAASSTDGRVVLMQFEPRELGVVVPRAQEARILGTIARSFGGTASVAQLPESTTTLAMEDALMRQQPPALLPAGGVGGAPAAPAAAPDPGRKRKAPDDGSGG